MHLKRYGTTEDTFKTFCEQLLSTYNATPDEWEHYELLCLDERLSPTTYSEAIKPATSSSSCLPKQRS